MLTTFDQKLAEYLNGYQVNGWPVGNLILVMIALVLSMLLCGAVGLEREIRGRSAGLSVAYRSRPGRTGGKHPAFRFRSQRAWYPV